MARDSYSATDPRLEPGVELSIKGIPGDRFRYIGPAPGGGFTCWGGSRKGTGHRGYRSFTYDRIRQLHTRKPKMERDAVTVPAQTRRRK